MKLTDLAHVQQLSNDRHTIGAALRAVENDLNVQAFIDGVAQNKEISIVIAPALVSHFRARIAEIDEELEQLGVTP